MLRVLLPALVVANVGFAQSEEAGQKTSKPFTSMAIQEDASNECRAPRPPRELATKAYTRNGYRAILRILAAERWQETQSCECFLTAIPWDEVIAEADRFKSSEDPDRPFDVSELRTRADQMLAVRDEACTE